MKLYLQKQVASHSMPTPRLKDTEPNATDER